MSGGANISDIDALSGLKAAFGNFAENIQQILPGLQKQFEEILERLEDRQRFWEHRVEQASDQLYSAREDLDSCESSGYYDEDGDYQAPNCSTEEDMVYEAERFLAECEANLETVKQWRRRIENQISDFQNDMYRLSHLASKETESAQAFLTRKVDILKKYTGDKSYIGTRLFAGDSYGNLNTEFDNLKVKLVLRSIEDDLSKRRNTEKVIILDAYGNVLAQQVGGDNEVTAIIPREKLPLVRNGIVTHNHPRGFSFSSSDLESAIGIDVGELRAVGVSQPYTYSLKRPLDGWPSNMPERYHAIYHDLLIELDLAIENGKLTEQEATNIIQHEVMKKLSKELNLDYERKRRIQI